MSRLPSVLFHSDLPEAELHAAKLDGEVYCVDRCFSPVDEIEGQLGRARSLVLSVPGTLIAEQRTAAWVHGALRDPPLRHQFCTDITARMRPPALVAITVREVVIEDRDLLDLAGLRITTPLRTVVDLARNIVEFDDDELSTIGDLMRIGRFGAAECRALLDRRRNLPNKRLALERIEEAARRVRSVSAGQPPLTR
jgi:hypothetical protein